MGRDFIGQYFIPLLINDGYEVRLLVRDKVKAIAKFGESCEYFIGDVTDKQSLKGCCENVKLYFTL